MKHVCVYSNWNPLVGGVKTACIELMKALKKKGYKLTFAYTQGMGLSAETLFHYSDVADVYKITPDLEIDCDVCVIASNHKVPEQVKAKKYLQWIHTDYNKASVVGGKISLHPNPQVTDYVAVSEHAAQVARDRFGVKVHTIHNLIDEDYGKGLRSPIKFVTVSRLSVEKGFKRMLEFVKMLEEREVDFVWDVFGNSCDTGEEKKIMDLFKDYPNVRFLGVSMDTKLDVANADYLVQLSNYEGYPYTVLEALMLSTPAIITDYPGSKEIIKDGKNGYIVPMDVKKITKAKLDKIIKKIPKFTHKQTGKVEQWEKLF